MILRQSGPLTRRDAPALRFLALYLAAWIVLRLFMVWSPAVVFPPDRKLPPWAVPAPFAVPAKHEDDDRAVRVSATRAAFEPIPRQLRRPGRVETAAPDWPVALAATAVPAGEGFGGDLHRLRLALLNRVLPVARGTTALSSTAAAWMRAPTVARAPSARGTPFWMQRSLDGWSLGGWLYLRDGGSSAPGAIAAGSQLGGSQAGLRLAYGFGDSGRARSYGRAVMAIDEPQQREVAFGVAFAPVVRLPVDISVEQRIAAGRAGRTALAVMMSGGVDGVALPRGFRLDAYAQAGVVGASRRDGFADGAVTIDRGLGRDDKALLRLGALAAGAVQPGAARVDVGPRLTLRLPKVGEGSRVALDWRQRIAGDARPESGLALTLAADF